MRTRRYTAVFKKRGGSTEGKFLVRASHDDWAYKAAMLYLGRAVDVGWELIRLSDYRHEVDLDALRFAKARPDYNPRADYPERYTDGPI